MLPSPFSRLRRVGGWGCPSSESNSELNSARNVSTLRRRAPAVCSHGSSVAHAYLTDQATARGRGASRRGSARSQGARSWDCCAARSRCPAVAVGLARERLARRPGALAAACDWRCRQKHGRCCCVPPAYRDLQVDSLHRAPSGLETVQSQHFLRRLQ
jgi:hypothetical protein